ncbi:hypothetical protein PHYBLDRAFT_170314 [Phycomyces blakesleeanus NRRL 1555(-)]|uniref:Uncharacterized protein n=1 Tax=Phycomyces blakesleeanus (strain ATCC 8743b / DSM 1359 / FGSC 10004 / NBRC 33097 / NRRL 1555) TaxID=763407 RepID=A0A162WYY6_PHYB8|nr:hypothetical protein PHYBLDRAFT_170314 [Phycomyces blakesleeanus NRRL 1555(-)]OAD71655.1 hypothetical protein PHYBLDRAFT_170314 [Phycomyces blakesleeanus NRRL 1555(-)]|eukprot:XP_018289695.1 hypothetical protein PHYBLDRAFT_170314 [Phycomyces blakesleeanus NRRL 1555(-)]
MAPAQLMRFSGKFYITIANQNNRFKKINFGFIKLMEFNQAIPAIKQSSLTNMFAAQNGNQRHPSFQRLQSQVTSIILIYFDSYQYTTGKKEVLPGVHWGSAQEVVQVGVFRLPTFSPPACYGLVYNSAL